ncbi:MAG: hypothetical protein ACRC4W_00585 [Treponemataceae bacterium]
MAKEIYEEYDSKTATMRKLCKKYHISFTEMYRLYYHHRDNIAKKNQTRSLNHVYN